MKKSSVWGDYIILPKSPMSVRMVTNNNPGVRRVTFTEDQQGKNNLSKKKL